MSLYFRNVDVELLAFAKPVAFLRTLRQADASILISDEQSSGWFVCFEIGGLSGSAAQVLTGLKRFFAGLTPAARAEWDEADLRVLDFGYDLEDAERVRETEISSRFVAFAASVNASIRITIYDENHSSREAHPR